MTKKVLLAIFDKDLKCRTVKKYPLTKDGSKIAVKTGGKGNFKPRFDNDSFLELPYRPILTPWKTAWKRMYFVRNNASACVNFQTETIAGPDPEAIIEAAQNDILRNFGTEEQKTPLIMWFMLLVLLAIAAKVFGVIG